MNTIKRKNFCRSKISNNVNVDLSIRRDISNPFAISRLATVFSATEPRPIRRREIKAKGKYVCIFDVVRRPRARNSHLRARECLLGANINSAAVCSHRVVDTLTLTTRRSPIFAKYLCRRMRYRNRGEVPRSLGVGERAYIYFAKGECH